MPDPTTHDTPKGAVGPAAICSAWALWSAADLAREIRARMNYLYGQTDGTMRFSNSAEGDLIKMVYALLEKPNDEMRNGERKTSANTTDAL